MTNKNILGGIAIVIVGAVVGWILLGFFGGEVDTSTGGVYSQSEQSFGEGASFGTTRQLVISNAGAVTGNLAVTGTGSFTGDVTFSGGSGGVNIPTAAGATSSITVGKIQTYATSAATAICIGFNTQGTTSVSLAGDASGAVVWKYGSCL